MDLEALAAALGPVVKDAIAKACEPLTTRIGTLEAELAAHRGDTAKAFQRQDDAKAETTEATRQLVALALDQARNDAEALVKDLPDSAEIEAMVGRATAPALERLDAVDVLQRILSEGLLAAQRGIEDAEGAAKARSAELEERCYAAFSELVKALPKPENGKDADVDEVLRQARAAAAEEVTTLTDAALPKMADTLIARIRLDLPDLVAAHSKELAGIIAEAGPKITAEARAAIEQAASEIPKPKDGENGRDAAHLEVLPAIDEAKSYPRGTYATHLGGLWRSFETTSGRRGWECIVDGVAGFEIAYADEMRSCSVKMFQTSGIVIEKTFHLPALIYRGVWKSQAYATGDFVTKDGSTWMAVGTPDAGDEPGASKLWQMAVRKGRDGLSTASRAAALSPVSL